MNQVKRRYKEHSNTKGRRLKRIEIVGFQKLVSLTVFQSLFLPVVGDV